MTLNNHIDKYNLSSGERFLSFLTLSGIVYSQRHWALSNKLECTKTRWGHRTIAILEAIPVLGGLISIIAVDVS